MALVFAKAFGLAVALLALNLLFGTMAAFPAEVGVGVGVEVAPGAPPPPREAVWVEGEWH